MAADTEDADEPSKSSTRANSPAGWTFKDALAFVHTSPAPNYTVDARESAQPPNQKVEIDHNSHIAVPDNETEGVSLGDLGSIWNTLGVPASAPDASKIFEHVRKKDAVASLEPFEAMTAEREADAGAYVSEGALPDKTRSRNALWSQANEDPGNVTSFQPGESAQKGSRITKTQRKKDKKARQRASRIELAELEAESRSMAAKILAMKKPKQNAALVELEDPDEAEARDMAAKIRAMNKANRISKASNTTDVQHAPLEDRASIQARYMAAKTRAKNKPSQKTRADLDAEARELAAKIRAMRKGNRATRTIIDDELQMVQEAEQKIAGAQQKQPSTEVHIPTSSRPKDLVNGQSQSEQGRPGLTAATTSSGLTPARSAALSMVPTSVLSPSRKTPPSSTPTCAENMETESKVDHNQMTPSRAPATPKQWPTADPAAELEKTIRKGYRQSAPTLEEIVNASRASKQGSTGVASASPFAQQTPQQATAIPTQTKTMRARHQIQPLQQMELADRHWSLLRKIIKAFPESKKTMCSPMTLAYHHPDSPPPNGLHVFIDSSNITIGYLDLLKRTRNIPDYVRTERIYPSFAALALLLERRRPAAKRVLVGSSPHVEFFDEASAYGYEVSILERVHKVRELTARQKAFAIRDAARRNGATSGSGGDSNGTSDEGAVQLPPQPMRFVEQGVDEVIHVKMAESYADVKEPATVVVATGDAQIAEYSSGFAAWVKRLLERGWNVEIAAWSANTSQEYFQLERSQTYAGRFRIIKLDSFVEELFSTEDDE